MCVWVCDVMWVCNPGCPEIDSVSQCACVFVYLWLSYYSSLSSSGITSVLPDLKEYFFSTKACKIMVTLTANCALDLTKCYYIYCVDTYLYVLFPEGCIAISNCPPIVSFFMGSDIRDQCFAFKMIFVGANSSATPRHLQYTRYIHAVY